jgi:hypothetical protein
MENAIEHSPNGHGVELILPNELGYERIAIELNRRKPTIR